MAARTNRLTHNQKTIDKIRTSQILNFLHNHIDGKLTGVDPSRVTAALGLLKKVKPDLSATTLSGEVKISHESQLEQLK